MLAAIMLPLCTYSFDVFQSMKFRAETTVYAQELLVHDSGQRQRTERVHTCIVDLFSVFVLAFQFEGEVICQMPAFVVSTKKPESVGIPYLQRPEVEDALQWSERSKFMPEDSPRC